MSNMFLTTDQLEEYNQLVSKTKRYVPVTTGKTKDKDFGVFFTEYELNKGLALKHHPINTIYGQFDDVKNRAIELLIKNNYTEGIYDYCYLEEFDEYVLNYIVDKIFFLGQFVTKGGKSNYKYENKTYYTIFPKEFSDALKDRIIYFDYHLAKETNCTFYYSYCDFYVLVDDLTQSIRKLERDFSNWAFSTSGASLENPASIKWANIINLLSKYTYWMGVYYIDMLGMPKSYWDYETPLNMTFNPPSTESTT